MSPTTIRVTFLGDTLVGGEGQAVLDQHGPDHAFDGIRHLLADADLVVANLEGPITDRAEPGEKHDIGRKRYWYRARADSLGAMARAGIRVVGLANNHVLDHGPEGLADTIAALDDAGVAHCGAGANRTEARRATVLEVGGLRLGFLAAMQRYDIYVAEQVYAGTQRPGPARLNAERIARDLDRLRTRADVRIVLAHWGRNYRRRNGRQVRLAGTVVDAGADLVIGHHPHVPHPIELVQGVPVAYSLGNGPLGTPGRYHSGRPPYGLVCSVDLEVPTGAVSRLRVVPILVDNAVVAFRPVEARDEAARALVSSLLTPALDWRPDGPAGWAADLPPRDTAPGGEVVALDRGGDLTEP